MNGSDKDRVRDIHRRMKECLLSDDILNDATGKRLEEISVQAVNMCNEYLEKINQDWLDKATPGITRRLKPRFKDWAERTRRDIPSSDDVEAVIHMMPAALSPVHLTKEDYDALKPIRLFAGYKWLIRKYTKIVNELYKKMAGSCRHYYRGTTSVELECLRKSHERWAKHYEYNKYCCLTSSPTAALYYSSKSQNADKDRIVLRYYKDRKAGYGVVLRYSKKRASKCVRRCRYGLSNRAENIISEPAQLHLMHEMEIRLKSTADPRELDMDIILFVNDPKKRKKLKERYGSLGNVIFTRRDAEEILRV